MRKSERTLLFAGVVAWAGFWAFDSVAQTYPDKPIRMYVGVAAGGATDITARLVGQKLSESLGQQVVIDNRPGSSTAIATDRVAKSPADGYSLLLIPNSTGVLSGMRNDLPYDLMRDLAPVSLVATGYYVLAVNPQVPARDVKGLIALAQSQPGKLNYASVGIGSAHHLAGELFKLRAKVDIVHVPFKGAAPADAATASGEVQVSFTSLAGARPFLDAGRIRALGVTSTSRLPSLPSVPTIDEAGLAGYNYSAWYGISTPAGVPKDIVMRLNTALGKIVNTPEMKERLFKLGFEAESSTPEQFATIIRREIERTVELVRLTGLKVE